VPSNIQCGAVIAEVIVEVIVMVLALQSRVRLQEQPACPPRWQRGSIVCRRALTTPRFRSP
jgi:hypothetical protein